VLQLFSTNPIIVSGAANDWIVFEGADWGCGETKNHAPFLGQVADILSALWFVRSQAHTATFALTKAASQPISRFATFAKRHRGYTRHNNTNPRP
jgi:hypothetical protein